MNKKTFYVISAVLIIIAIAGILFLMRDRWSGGSSQPTKTPVSEVPQTPEEIKEITRRAMDNRNSDLCEQIRSESDKKWCLRDAVSTEAATKNDPEICQKLEDGESKSTCLYLVVTTRALGANDQSICEELVDVTKRQECKDYVATYGK